MNAPEHPAASQRLVLVTGPSGAGRTTAIRALEDLGFETIDNIPLTLLPRLFEDRRTVRPVAVGIDVRNRDFSPDALLAALDTLAADARIEPELLYLDARAEVLERRYSETRRRHPLSPEGAPTDGIAAEGALLARIRDRADILIDTSDLSPNDLRAEVEQLARGHAPVLSVTVESFSYKKGVPAGADIVLDCRFLTNPYWQEDLRDLDGRSTEVADFVRADPAFEAFAKRLHDLLDLLLPAYAAQGKTHLRIALGCTGGQHRSVAVAELAANALAENGWPVSKRHRELDGRASDVRERAWGART